jgi:hypothetical protein
MILKTWRSFKHKRRTIEEAHIKNLPIKNSSKPATEYRSNVIKLVLDFFRKALTTTISKLKI